MNILYVGKHGSGGNDDEGAIHYALEQLGHSVQRVREVAGNTAHRDSKKFDFCLVHGWHDFESMKKIKCPIVFWFFDLVTFSDPTLLARNKARMSWIRQITDIAKIGFCTDGDWVRRVSNAGETKLFCLRQGADERQMRKPNPIEGETKILFTGISKGGMGRQNFVDEMREQYGDRFHHVEKGVYGSALADLISQSRIVVAPDFPVTDNYWSNRVYNALGMGAFLIHPWAWNLTSQYYDGKDLVLYHSRQGLFGCIDKYLSQPEERLKIANSGWWTTRNEHTYRHRCVELIEVVKERLK